MDIKAKCENCRWFDLREQYCIERQMYCRPDGGEGCEEFRSGWKNEKEVKQEVHGLQGQG